MKKRNILAVAMSVSLVLGGAYYANTNNNLAYAEEEKEAEKSLDQLIAEKQAEIEKLNADTKSKESQIAELEKDLKDLTNLYNEFDALLEKRQETFKEYKPKLDDYIVLEKDARVKRDKQTELLIEYQKLSKDLENDPNNKELEKKKSDKANEWEKQRKIADEAVKVRNAKGKEIASLGEELRAMDTELEERNEVIFKEEDANYEILDKINPLKSDVKNNNRRVLTLNTQIQSLEEIKADLAKDNEESGKPLDEQIIDKEGKVSKLKEDIDNKKAEVAKLEGQIIDISELKNNFALKEQALNQNSEDFKNARDELEQAKTEYENANEIRKNLYNSWYEAKQKLNKNPNDKKLEKEVYDKGMEWTKQDKIANEAKDKVREATAKASALSKENSIIVKEYEVLRDDLYAKEEINDNLNFQISLLNTNIEYNNKRIESLNNKIDEINEAIELEEEKESLIEKINKLEDLSDEDKEKAIEEITNAENKQVAINAYNKAFSLNQDNKYEREKKEKLEAFEKEKEEAKEALDKLADKLSPEDLKSYKDQIDNAKTKGAIDNILKDAEEKANESETPDSKDEGYDSKEEAIKAAEEALKDDEINKSYDLYEKDGKWFYTLSPVEKEEEPEVPEEPADDEEEQETPETEEEGFDSKEEAMKAAEKALENDPINKSYDLFENNGKWFYTLSPIEREEPVNPEEPESPEAEEEGFDSKEEAIKAAEEALKDDEINKSYDLYEKDGKWFYTLSPVEKEEEPADDEEPETPEEPEVDSNENEDEPEIAEEIGYDSEEEAIAAAKKALADDPINNSYDVQKGLDGKWYYVLSPIEKEDGKVESETKENENQKNVENLDIEELKKINEKDGFATKDAASKAAKIVLEKDLINKSYSVAQGANGNYFFLLSPLEFDK